MSTTAETKNNQSMLGGKIATCGQRDPAPGTHAAVQGANACDHTHARTHEHSLEHMLAHATRPCEAPAPGIRRRQRPRPQR